jgi:hypothetical protein
MTIFILKDSSYYTLFTVNFTECSRFFSICRLGYTVKRYLACQGVKNFIPKYYNSNIQSYFVLQYLLACAFKHSHF